MKLLDLHICNLLDLANREASQLIVSNLVELHDQLKILCVQAFWFQLSADVKGNEIGNWFIKSDGDQ